MENEPARRALMRMLDAGGSFGPEYGPNFSNHLPMGLCSLFDLGADAARLQRFFERYATRLRGREPPGAAFADHEAWRTALGAPGSFEAHFETVRTGLAREGRRRTLQRLLPVLLADPGAALFHGMIRTAHAVAVGHDGEVAAGLAYWSARWNPARWEDGRPDDAGLATLARRAARIYAASGDFYGLHVVTGSLALHVLLPSTSDPGLAQRRFAGVAASIWCSRGAQDTRDEAPPGESPAAASWGRIAGAACAVDDEHVIKLVHACQALSSAFGGEEFRDAALRALQGAEPVRSDDSR